MPCGVTINKNYRKWLIKAWPWILLMFGLFVFYDFNPLYPMLLRVGINAHLPIPQVVDDTWNEATRPTINSIDAAKLSAAEDRVIPGSAGVVPPALCGSVVLNTQKGPINMRTYLSPKAQLGVVFVGGVGGGFDSPAQRLYDRLGASLPLKGVSAVHLSFRNTTEFAQTVHDVRAAVSFLEKSGHTKVVLIGHSMGAASVISAASFEPSVVALAAMSGQPYGANRVRSLQSRRLLVVSGLLDVVEPPCWSSAIYKEAVANKEMVHFLALHNLDECGDQVYDRILGWILQ